ncbi:MULTISPECIES: hypothetical protein [unclassified Streptomyces]|uniref:hypothetical protein n=1 Tax=unclassified Streptomyces TaxID=2593676 RepID=UPI002E183B6E|nr:MULTISPECIES: hypothetical protein [unclassified Streptomyces]
MTPPPPDENLLFDVAALPTPVERLLLLADQYVQHNDMLDCLLRNGTPPEPNAHVASAQQLAAATRTALKVLTDERLFQSRDLSDAVVRLQQLAFLSDASADQQLPTARVLTALAPNAAMGCANTLAHESRRRRSTANDGPGQPLSAAHATALWEVACGNVVATSSLGRQYVHYRDERILIGTLRSLEAKGLAVRAAKSAPSAYIGGPLQDRVRLTLAGTTALAAAISSPLAPTAPGTTPAPTLTAAKTAARSRA